MKTENKAYYTPKELEDVLPFGRNTIYRELRAGTIPSLRFGRKFLIPKAALARLFESAGQPEAR